ncbi:MAG: hypothetical protein Q7T82_18220 [Armatimonadota bacterium]|nr:hypothetical protein [Armatimonadota bacterium]
MSDTDILENAEDLQAGVPGGIEGVPGGIEGVVERDALLFRAGYYPDKDIEVTEEDLDRIVENFAPAPIKVEHTDTPLRFGALVRIWRTGRELFGRLAFNPLAWALARECGATKLSVAVRRDKTGLREVSLVRSPRIADAAVFSREAEYFAGEDLAAAASAPGETISEGGEHMQTRQETLPETDESVDFAGRVAALERELRAKDVDARVEDLKRQGKLAPAAEAFARSLLMAADDQVVTFADPATGAESKESVAKTFEAFLGAQPKVIEFAELTPGLREEKPGFSAEDEKLFEKLGVTGETVARYQC